MFQTPGLPESAVCSLSPRTLDAGEEPLSTEGHAAHPGGTHEYGHHALHLANPGSHLVFLWFDWTEVLGVLTLKHTVIGRCVSL